MVSSYHELESTGCTHRNRLFWAALSLPVHPGMALALAKLFAMVELSAQKPLLPGIHL
jgi:hypothetical protein